MRKLILIPIAVILFFKSQLFAQSASEKEEYVVVRENENITMFERWIPYPGTATNARQIKCVFQVATSLNNMFDAIHEEGKIKTWQKNIIEYKVIPITDTTWLTYSFYEIPWPLTNQDYLLHYAFVTRSEKKMVVTFDHSRDAATAPIREGVDRMPTYGSWVLEKISDEKIKVTYTASSMPVSYPRFITDRIVRNNLMSTITALIAIAEK